MIFIPLDCIKYTNENLMCGFVDNFTVMKTSTTNRAGVRDPHAHFGHPRAHTLLGTVIWLFIPASVHCTLVVHLTSCLYCTAEQ
jgi:hypothetical protein